MMKANIKIGTDQIVEIGECHLEVEPSTDRILEEGHKILKECRIIEVKILEVDIEVTIAMKILKEVKVGLEKDSIQIIFKEIIKALVDQDHIQEPVLIGIGLIILLKTVQTQIQKKSSQNKYNKCLI